MGQAKQRGSFEERQIEAITQAEKVAVIQAEVRAATEAALTPAEREARKNARLRLSMITGFATGLYPLNKLLTNC